MTSQSGVFFVLLFEREIKLKQSTDFLFKNIIFGWSDEPEGLKFEKVIFLFFREVSHAATNLSSIYYLKIKQKKKENL